MLPNILPCPFCCTSLNNQDPMDTIYPVSHEKNPDGTYKTYQIFCHGCGATILGDSKEECIKLWNTRA